MEGRRPEHSTAQDHKRHKLRLGTPSDIKLDTIQDEIIVSNWNGSVTTYGRTADGNCAPVRTISGGSTYLNEPNGITLDTIHNEILVANANDASQGVWPDRHGG